MWPFTKLFSKHERTLRAVLLDINQLVEKSTESDWTPFSPKQVSSDLLMAVVAIDENGTIDAATLRMHFAPTGSLQEIAMSNQWTDEYMRLSTEFDELIERA